MKALNINVSSEIGRLECLLVHHPNKGIGRITPEKLEDWLYDDTVYLARMQDEYDVYLQILLWFLDEDRIRLHRDRDPVSYLRPDNAHYIDSPFVLDVQKELSDLLASDEGAKERLLAVVCALENADFKTQKMLETMTADKLASVLISGYNEDNPQTPYLFPPLPNLVFTRDIGIVIQDHLLISKTLYQARKRESILAKSIAFNHFFKKDRSKVIEISEPNDFFLLNEQEQKQQIISIEGGDIMMISPRHLLVGWSERTSAQAGVEIIHEIFSRNLGIDKVSIVKIPPTRAQMHIDTIFTQVRRDVWAMYGAFSEELRTKKEGSRHTYKILSEKIGIDGPACEIIQFFLQKHKGAYDPGKDYCLKEEDYQSYGLKIPIGLDGLLRQISELDFGCHPSEVKIIYSGNNKFPFDEREQWTDSCNYLALREGVVIGYDRNEHTATAFREAGFDVIGAGELIKKFKSGEIKPAEVENTLIELPSAELSRARGGSHCMSMPLRRSELE